MNAPFLIVLAVFVLVARNRMLSGSTTEPLRTAADRNGSIIPAFIAGSPSPVGTEGTGNTNPLSVFGSAIHNLFWPKVTLPGNAPLVGALPAGPPGDITASEGGTPGAPPDLDPVSPFDYNPAFDSPAGYYDMASDTFIPH